MSTRNQRGGYSSHGQTNIIVTSKREDPFARIPHTLLEDDSLSWKAKGVLCYLVGKPSGWKVRIEDICKRGLDGKDSVRGALNELRDLGYAELVRICSEKGKVKEWVWKISDSPIFHPHTEKPDVGNPDLENPHHSKNKVTKKEFSKIQSKETKGSKETGSSPVRYFSPAKEEDPLPDIPAKWSPHPLRDLTKEEQLKKIRTPRNIPSEWAFDEFLSVNDCHLLARGGR